MTDDAGRVTALQAMTKATEAVAEISKHEAVCAERYANTEKTLASIQGLLRRVGVTAIAAIISLAIWGGEQYFTVSNAKSDAQTAQSSSFPKPVRPVGSGVMPTPSRTGALRLRLRLHRGGDHPRHRLDASPRRD